MDPPTTIKIDAMTMDGMIIVAPLISRIHNQLDRCDTMLETGKLKNTVRELKVAYDQLATTLVEQRKQYERNMIALLKERQIAANTVQTSVRSAGDLRKMITPKKKKRKASVKLESSSIAEESRPANKIIKTEQ
jgi:hypothetical protein